QVAEKGDVVAQLHKAKELQDIARGALGGGLSGADVAPPSAPASPWGEIDLNDIIEKGLEKFPEIVNAVRGTGGAPPAPAQQHYPGQVVSSPQGPMVVVQDPNTGQLGLTPKAQWDAYQRSRQQPTQPLLPTGEPKQRRQNAGPIVTPSARPQNGMA